MNIIEAIAILKQRSEWSFIELNVDVRRTEPPKIKWSVYTMQYGYFYGDTLDAAVSAALTYLPTSNDNTRIIPTAEAVACVEGGLK